MLYYCMVWKPEIKLRKTSKQKCLKNNTEACSPIPLPKHLLSRLRLSADCSRVVPMWLARTGQKKIKHVAMSLPLPCIFLPPSLPWRLQQATVNLAKGHWLWHLHRAELSEREPTPKKNKHDWSYKHIDSYALLFALPPCGQTNIVKPNFVWSGPAVPHIGLSHEFCTISQQTAHVWLRRGYFEPVKKKEWNMLKCLWRVFVCLQACPGGFSKPQRT